MSASARDLEHASSDSVRPRSKAEQKAEDIQHARSEWVTWIENRAAILFTFGKM